ncbi:hypothetical protein D3C86_2075740 [compost metagenome]
MGGILDDEEAVAVRKGLDGLHVARLTCEVNGDDDLGKAARLLGQLELGFEGRYAHVVGLGIDVHEVDVGPAVQRAVR